MKRDTLVTVAGGMALGVGAMYFLDARSGGRRRGLVRDQLGHQGCRVRHSLAVLGENLLNRGWGQIAELRARLAPQLVSDDVLIARVRAEMGHVLRHAHAIEVEVANGKIVLRGVIDPDQVEPLLQRLASVPGVPPVDNHLVVREVVSPPHGLVSG